MAHPHAINPQVLIALRKTNGPAQRFGGLLYGLVRQKRLVDRHQIVRSLAIKAKVDRTVLTRLGAHLHLVAISPFTLRGKGGAHKLFGGLFVHMRRARKLIDDVRALCLKLRGVA